MIQYIGSASVEGITELASRFDGSAHSWSGPQVKIKSIEYWFNVEIGSIGVSKTNGELVGASVGVSKWILEKITDERGLELTKQISLSRFKERMLESNYRRGETLVGWSTGPNPITLNDLGNAILKRFEVM